MPQSLLPWVRKVVVGSTNPVKLAAVRAVIARVAPSATVQSAEVISGVADQPWGDEETQRGAAERARRAIESEDDADIGIGLEGGVVELNGAVRTCAWAAVVARDGRVGTGGSMAMQLPEKVVALLKAGIELGHAMDTVAQLADTKRRSGAVGILTAGLDRSAARVRTPHHVRARSVSRTAFLCGRCECCGRRQTDQVAASGRWSVRTRTVDEQWLAGAGENFVSHTAQHEPHDSGASVRGHGDRAGTRCCSVVDERVGR